MKLFGHIIYKTSLLLVVIVVLVASQVQCMNQVACIDKTDNSVIISCLKELPSELQSYVFFLSLGATLSYNFTFSKALSQLPDATRAVTLSPDGATILAGSGDKTAHILDAQTGHRLVTLKGHRLAISSVAFSPDGKILLTGSFDKTARLWDSKTGNLLKTLEGPSPILSVAFAPTNSEIILTGGNDAIAYLWNSNTGKLLLSLKGHTSWIHAVAFSPNGKIILTGSDDETARLWDTETGKELRVLKRSIESTCSIEDGSEEVLVGLMDFPQNSSIKTRAELEKPMDNSTSMCSVAFSPDGKTILTGSDDWTACLWDTKTGKQLMVLKGHGGSVCSTAFSPDGNTILTGSVDNTACLWDAKTGIPLKTLRKHTASVFAAVFSPNGRAVFTSSLDESAFIWSCSEDSYDWALTRPLSGQEVYIKLRKLLYTTQAKDLLPSGSKSKKCFLF